MDVKKIFLYSLMAVTAFSATDGLHAQEAKKKIAPAEFVEVRPYGDTLYSEDRRMTGAIFRKLRRIRAAEGNQAAAARLPAAWKTYQQLRINGNSEPKSSFEKWSFWVWHEAQYDTGKVDSEWQLLLYKSIYDLAKANNFFDSCFHVRSSLMICHANLCQWAQVRTLGNEAEDYLSGIGFDLDPCKLP